MICSDELGLSYPGVLEQALKTTATEDLYVLNAETLIKEKAREVERAAHTAASGGSELNVFFIYSLQRLPPDSVGPLLKAVEDAKSSRFIFQAQSVPDKIRTLMSRSSVVKLPFVSKQAVLGMLQRLRLDAKTADQSRLWDGTLGGTARALGMREHMAILEREISAGMAGIPALFKENERGGSLVGSLALLPVLEKRLNPNDLDYIRAEPNPVRKKILLLLMAGGRL